MGQMNELQIQGVTDLASFSLGKQSEREQIVAIIKKLREPHRKGSSGRANFDLLLNLIEGDTNGQV